MSAMADLIRGIGHGAELIKDKLGSPSTGSEDGNEQDIQAAPKPEADEPDLGKVMFIHLISDGNMPRHAKLNQCYPLTPRDWSHSLYSFVFILKISTFIQGAFCLCVRERKIPTVVFRFLFKFWLWLCVMLWDKLTYLSLFYYVCTGCFEYGLKKSRISYK